MRTRNIILILSGVIVVLLIIFVIFTATSSKSNRAKGLAINLPAAVSDYLSKLSPNPLDTIGALPDESSYWAKLWKEDLAKLFLSGDKEKEYNLDLAKKRLLETEFMLAIENPKAAEKSAKAYAALWKKLSNQNLSAQTEQLKQLNSLLGLVKTLHSESVLDLFTTKMNEAKQGFKTIKNDSFEVKVIEVTQETLTVEYEGNKIRVGNLQDAGMLDKDFRVKSIADIKINDIIIIDALDDALYLPSASDGYGSINAKGILIGGLK